MQNTADRNIHAESSNDNVDYMLIAVNNIVAWELKGNITDEKTVYGLALCPLSRQADGRLRFI